MIFLSILSSNYGQNIKGYIYQHEGKYIFTIEKRINDTIIIYSLQGKVLENKIAEDSIKNIYYNLDSLIGNGYRSLINRFISYNNYSKGYKSTINKWLYLDEFQIQGKKVLVQPISRQKFYFKNKNVYIVDERSGDSQLFTDFKYYKTKNVDVIPLHANATLIKGKNEYLIDIKFLNFDFVLPYSKFIVDQTFHVTSYYFQNKWYDVVL